MQISEAIHHRRSIRAFNNRPVSGKTVEALLRDAAQAPSGGNIQPWHVHAVTGAPLTDLKTFIEKQGFDPRPGYQIYPEPLAHPYKSRRAENGDQLYAALDIGREDKAGRAKQLMKNASFFGAPVGIFIFVDRNMGYPQWADLGMYLQTLLLLATEAGLDTCPQAFWTMYATKVEAYLNVPDDRMLYCGIALGHQDASAPVNQFRTTRAPLHEWCTLSGFQEVSQ